MPKGIVDFNGWTPEKTTVTFLVETLSYIAKYSCLKTSSKLMDDETFTLYVERVKKY